MFQTREIVYDYKIRIEWGREQKRRRQLRWALAMAAPIAVALLGGMASHQIRNHEFQLPPWGTLFEKPIPTADQVLPIPVRSQPVAAAAPPPIAMQEPASNPFTPQPLPVMPAVEPPLEDDVRAEEPPAPPAATEVIEVQAEAENWQTVTVRGGDNLSLIFGRLGLSSADLDRIISLGGDTLTLKHLKPDDNLQFRINGSSLEEMVHEIDSGHTLHVRNQRGSFTAETIAEDLQTRAAHTTGHIESSLFEAGQSAGLHDAMTMQLADVFGYDLDLVLDIRAGDRFSVVFEEIYKDGKKIENGDILAAEFINQGRVYRAVRYADADGRADYYRPDGQSLRRAFIRTPVAFTRITSRFNLQRKHPILNRIRAHKGVDYAAPNGTPVNATGDAKVAFAGWKGGYGRLIMLEHRSGYTTVYGHLSRVAKRIKPGAKVEMGQTIGYVGQTGLATGPHLHYEFRVNGVHRDPLKVALPKSNPVDKDKLADFQAKTRTVVALLDEASAIATAASSKPGSAETADASGEASAPTIVASARQ